MRRVLLAAVLALLAMATHAKDESAPQRWSYAVLLDRSADDVERAEHLSRLEAWAARGDRDSRYLLGTLYRLGDDHPSRLLERDLDKAAALLGHAALAGSLPAMAGLAETELAADRPLAGMMWAQAFVNFTERYGMENPDSSRAYEAWLIHRLSEDMKRMHDAPDEQEVRETFNGFLQTHGVRIVEALERNAPREEPSQEFAEPPQHRLRPVGSSGGLMMGNNMSWRMDKRPREPGFAHYLIGVRADGKVEDVLVIDSAPEGRIATGMKRQVLLQRFNEAPEGTPTRWTAMAMYFDDGSASLRK